MQLVTAASLRVCQRKERVRSDGPVQRAGQGQRDAAEKRRPIRCPDAQDNGHRYSGRERRRVEMAILVQQLFIAHRQDTERGQSGCIEHAQLRLAGRRGHGKKKTIARGAQRQALGDVRFGDETVAG